MISWWIGLIIVVAISVILTKNELKSIMVAIVFIVICGLFFLDAEVEYEVLDSHEEMETVQIYSIGNTSTSNVNGMLTGGLFFSYGKIMTENGMCYNIMIGNDEEGYTVQTLDAKTTYLFMDENESPHIIKKYIVKDEYYGGNFIAGTIFKFDKRNETDKQLMKTELHIPQNSVEVNYNINMNN